MRAMVICVASFMAASALGQSGRRAPLELTYSVRTQEFCDVDGKGEIYQRIHLNLKYRNVAAAPMEIAMGAVAVTGVQVAGTVEELRLRKLEYWMEGELPTLRPDQSVPWNVDPVDARPLIALPDKFAEGSKVVPMTITRNPVNVRPGLHMMRILTYVRTRRILPDGQPAGAFEWRSVWSAPTPIDIPAKPTLVKCEGVGD